MNTRAFRGAIPALYAAAVFIGFLVNARAGVIVAIGGALVSSALYALIARTSVTPEMARRPPRRRNRGR